MWLRSRTTIFKVLVSFSVVFFVLIFVVILRVLSLESPAFPRLRLPTEDENFRFEATPDILDRFSRAIRIATISYDNDSPTQTNNETLKEFHRFLRSSFPVLHNSSCVSVETINELSLLYTIHGSDATRMPFMLAAHFDVVPVDAKRWLFPPFDGKIHDGFVYGRGALDDKLRLMAILEAVEYLLRNGFKPKNSFYVALGHDEEVSGKRGAREISRLLRSRGVELQFVVDEGLPVTKGVMKFVKQPVAAIGVAEKGYLTLKLTVTANPGHSATPPKSSAIGILAKAITRLEENPHLNMFGQGVEVSMLEYLAPYVSVSYGDVPFYLKLVFANLWLFSPIVSRVMDRDPVQSAFVRTSTAVTMFHSGFKTNVIPNEAVAYVNHRIHPLQTVDEVLAHDKAVISDERVHLEVISAHESSSSISPYGSSGLIYELLRVTINSVVPDAIVVPGVLMASTDCKWYGKLTRNVYRVVPAILLPDDIPRYHGDNERVSIANYETALQFYYRFILNVEMDYQKLLHLHKTEL